MKILTLLALLATLTLTGCASSYIAPGAKADLQAFAPASIQAGSAAKATAPFPASIAAVRVQSSGYANYHLRQSGGAYGAGRYSVVTTREVESDSQFERIARLPQVSGIVAINRMLLPQQLDSDKELREAAARLQGDLLLIYTFDTTFFDTDAARPITLLTLGLAPTKTIYVTTTASALLMDTRTGYVYSAYEATKKSDTSASAWSSNENADKARRANEQAAFDQLVDQFTSSWDQLLARHLKKPAG